MTDTVTRDWFAREGDICVDLDDAGILTIRLNRPERLNALTRPMLHELGDIFARAGESPDVRVIIMTGEGRGFCSGADAQSLADSADLPLEQRINERPKFTPRMVKIWKPSICAVNGICAGAGLHFASDLDVVIASDRASFTDTHVNIGQVTALEPIGLARRLPLGSVLRLMTMGKAERLSAEKALEVHLVSEVVAHDDLMKRAREIATIIAGVSPQAVQISLKAVWESFDKPLPQAFDDGYELLLRHRDHPDAREGPAAFMAKRDPVWTP